MWISSCCSFGNKWAHSKHHWCSTPMCCCLALSLEGSLQVQKLRQERTSFVQGCRLSLEDSEVQQTDKPRQSSSPPWCFQCFHRSSVNQLLPSKPSSQQGRTAAMFLLISWAGLLASGVTLWVWYTSSMESPIDHSGTALQKGEAMVTIWSFPAVSSQISKNTEKHFVQTLNSNDVSSI